MQVAIFLASLACEGSKAGGAGQTAFSGWMREAQKRFWTKQTSFTVWGNVLDRVIGHSNEPLLSPEGAWNPIEHTCWISDCREKALSVPSLPPVCVCSEPRRLGSSVSPQSRGQEGVSQVPQTLHLVCPRKNRWEAHPLLSTEVTRSPNTAWKPNEETFIYIIQGRKIIPFAFLKFSLLFQVPSGPGFPAGEAALFGYSTLSALPPECVFGLTTCWTAHLAGPATHRPVEGAGSHGFNPPAVVTWATLRWLNATCWPWMYFYVNFLRKRFPNWASN